MTTYIVKLQMVVLSVVLTRLRDNDVSVALLMSTYTTMQRESLYVIQPFDCQCRDNSYCEHKTQILFLRLKAAEEEEKIKELIVENNIKEYFISFITQEPVIYLYTYQNSI